MTEEQVPVLDHNFHVMGADRVLRACPIEERLDDTLLRVKDNPSYSLAERKQDAQYRSARMVNEGLDLASATNLQRTCADRWRQHVFAAVRVDAARPVVVAQDCSLVPYVNGLRKKLPEQLASKDLLWCKLPGQHPLLVANSASAAKFTIVTNSNPKTLQTDRITQTFSRSGAFEFAQTCAVVATPHRISSPTWHRKWTTAEASPSESARTSSAMQISWPQQ